mgnify:CR=1 FL=1
MKEYEQVFISGCQNEMLEMSVYNVENGKVFECGEIKIWKCRNCGHIHVALKAPEVCPVCDHPKAYFEIREENY